MKNRILFLVLLAIVVFSINTAYAQGTLGQQAYAILENKCLNCHGPGGTFTENLLIADRDQLIAGGSVVPNNPNASELYLRLITTDVAKRMPSGQPALSPQAIATINRWITEGALDWTVEQDINFITTDTLLDTIKAHLDSLQPHERPYARYFSLTHLYNAGETPEKLQAYRNALSKLVNSLSWGHDIIKPHPIDPRQTLLYIDLRHYEWDEWDTRDDVWQRIEQDYPYTREFDPETEADPFEKLTQLRQATKSNVPFIHADWFLATASLPPLYHDILHLPDTDLALEQQLNINVARNIQQSPGIRVSRAGVVKSGVSKNNRVVERHTSQYGAYWKSYDFAGSVGAQNIRTHPLSFKHDGGEIVFNLPNGLQAYYISDDKGNRIDKAPTNIVSNPAASDPAVRNGLSCIGCHTEGMKTFEDVMRTTIELTENPTYDKTQALRLYVGQDKMDTLLEQDTERYRQALVQATGGGFEENEPVHRAHEVFEQPLDAADAAAALGLKTEAFVQQIHERRSLQNLGLTSFLGGGTINRDAWTADFADIVDALNSEDSTVDPTPTPTPTPIEDVAYIPDRNLLAAVAAALGKPNATTITITEMETLTHLIADDAEIRDLTGLEAATNLERIEFRHNAISDLSPLRNLTRLNNIKLRGNKITDVSPLAKLVNVDWLGLEGNEITDLSPLKSLIKLNGIGIANNPILDISPLSSLRSLEGIEARNTLITDFSSLAELPRFRWIEFGHDRRIDTLPSLKGLKNLRRLVINHTGISDISGLAALTQLQSLTLHDNSIEDVSPLASLKSLTHLNLDGNVISDISSLEKLKSLKELYLQNNVISDVSSLAELSNLEQLDLRNNAISNFSPLEALVEKTLIKSTGNPGVLRQGGPKIKGPWLWVQFPGLGFDDFRNKDLLAGASGGDVTELEIATNGAMEGQDLGDKVWTSGKITSESWNNIRKMLGTRSDVSNIVYGSITLDSPREQKTTMFAGSADNHKVWLNGQLINEHYGWSTDYQVFFPATLKQGKNVLLISVHKWDGHLGGHFGFAPEAEYTVLSPGDRFSFSTAATQVKVDDRFTVQLKAENISDLAGWQADIIFDPAVLKANSVSEGGFLKQKGGRTHFLKGTIDNTEGRITNIGAARTSEGGASGEGTLLSVTFTAIANGESRLALRKFQAGSSLGETIFSRPPDMIITVGEPSIVDVGDDTFSLSTDVTPVRFGDSFTLRLRTNDVTDLAGWQTDIAFDADVLEAVEVSEGDFLKAEGGDTFFLKGTIDNAVGEIAKLSSARFGSGVSGTGTLLLVTFTAKATGETRVTFSDFFAGSSSRQEIPSDVPEIVITVEAGAFLASDVNRDGQVNVFDLILVSQYFGEDASANAQFDVNGDGTINVLDLIVVAQDLGESTAAAAPSDVAIENLALDPATVQAWIAQARIESDGSLAFQQGIENLQRLLALLLPDKTALLPNYPNPFNPETWIPYHLAEPADVRVHIYAADGALVRTLVLGHQVAGIYESRTRAVYWDGKNKVGEPVASGVYFYTLTAGDFMTTRKMLIRK